MKDGLSVHFMVKDTEMDRFAEKVAFMCTVADEIVIVDTGSSPADVAAMRSWDGWRGTEVKVVETEFTDFASSRNFGIKQHTRAWTFGMDPDELPSPALMDVLDAVSHRNYAAETEEYKESLGFLVITHSWWAGRRGPVSESDWHCRLWKTGLGTLYRPVHELVMLGGKTESLTRNTGLLPKLPEHNFLIHSKGYPEMVKSTELYRRMGEP